MRAGTDQNQAVIPSEDEMQDDSNTEIASEVEQERSESGHPQTDRLIETTDEEMSLPVFTMDSEAQQDESQGQTRISIHEESQNPPDKQRSYLLNTKLSDGRSALLLDIGSLRNLMS